MYGCFDGVVVYGFAEGNRSYRIDENYWDTDEYVDVIRGYALDVVRNHAGQMVYGVVASVDKKNGKAKITKKEREAVHALHKKISNGRKYGPIGFYVAILGDYENCHCDYNPDDEGSEAGKTGEEEEPKAAKRVKKSIT